MSYQASKIWLIFTLLTALLCLGAPVVPSRSGARQENLVVVTTPSTPHASTESTGVLELPQRAGRAFIVPHANTLLTKWDFSLPARYRAMQNDWNLDAYEENLLAMYRYHREELGDAQVPRPMEVDFPPIVDIQWGRYGQQARQAQAAMRTNAWLLTGKQIIMLNNVQHRLRSLTTQRFMPTSEDPIEARVLRSRLDSALKEAHTDHHNARTFPDLLRQALMQVYTEQAGYISRRDGNLRGQPDWDAVFPFLSSTEVDMTHFLLHY